MNLLNTLLSGICRRAVEDYKQRTRVIIRYQNQTLVDCDLRMLEINEKLVGPMVIGREVRLYLWESPK